jgi:hypothetical protein
MTATLNKNTEYVLWTNIHHSRRYILPKIQSHTSYIVAGCYNYQWTAIAQSV